MTKPQFLFSGCSSAFNLHSILVSKLKFLQLTLAVASSCPRHSTAPVSKVVGVQHNQDSTSLPSLHVLNQCLCPHTAPYTMPLPSHLTPHYAPAFTSCPIQCPFLHTMPYTVPLPSHPAPHNAPAFIPCLTQCPCLLALPPQNPVSVFSFFFIIKAS